MATAAAPFRAAARRGDVQVACVLGGVVWLIFTALGQGAITGPDGHSMYALTRSLGDHLSVAVPKTDGRLPGVDGHYYSPYGLGLPLISLLPYLLAKPIIALAGHADEIGQFAVSMAMPAIIGALAAALYTMTRRLGASRSSAIIIGFGAVFGTYLLPYGKDFFSEPLVVLCLVLMCERVLVRSFGLAGLALGFAVLTRPQTAITCPLLVALVLYRGGWRPALRVSAVLAGVAAVLAFYNWARFGDVTNVGYAGAETGFASSFSSGLQGLLLNPAKSVFLFAPIVLLVPFAVSRVRRVDRDVAIFLVVHALVLLLFYAGYGGWIGGWTWGPRYLLVAIIPMLPMLGPLIDSAARYRRAAAALFVAGALVSFSTLIVPVQAQQLDTPVSGVGPGIARQYELMPKTVGRSLTLLTGTPAATALGSHRLYLDLWQVGLLRKDGRAGLAAGLALTVALLAGSAVGAARYAGRDERRRRLPPSDCRGEAGAG